MIGLWENAGGFSTSRQSYAPFPKIDGAAQPHCHRTTVAMSNGQAGPRSLSESMSRLRSALHSHSHLNIPVLIPGLAPFPSHRQLGKRIVPVLHAQGRGGLRSAGRRCGQQIQIPNAIQLAVQAGAESSKCGVLREHLETKNPRRSAGPDIRRGRTESAVQRFRLISTSSISAPVWNDFELAL